MQVTDALHLESIIYYKLSTKIDSLLVYSAAFNLDPKVVASIIFVEQLQYDLPSVYSSLRSLKCTFLDMVKFLKMPVTGNKISEWLNLSQGFSHIKWHTARTAHKLINDETIYSSQNFADYTTNDDVAIKITCIILNLHITMWKQDYQDILLPENIDILATIYNISNFKNKLPHSEPKTGGSILDHICDGTYYSNLDFGTRVKMTYHSHNMDSFFKTIGDNLDRNRI